MIANARTQTFICRRPVFDERSSCMLSYPCGNQIARYSPTNLHSLTYCAFDKAMVVLGCTRTVDERWASILAVARIDAQ